jgi:hypothetical protein
MLKPVAQIDPRRTHRILAWSVVAIDLLGAAACAGFYALNRASAFGLLSTLAFGLLPLSGALIIAIQPRNLVGWLAAAVGLTFVGGDLLAQYGIYALLTRSGALPLGGLATWISAWSWMAVYPLAIPFLLLIPNGHLLSRRWLALIWAGVATGLPMIVFMGVMLLPVDKVLILKTQNFGPQVGPAWLLLWRAMQVWQPLQFLLILLATVGLFLRFSRSQGVERQQLKWIFLAITTIPVAVGLGFLNGDQNNNNSLFNSAYQVINLLSACSFPVALAFSVTRYRLYDIDVIVRRTLVYSSLTFILVLVYLGSVILLQEVFTLLTGQHSTASIVISTLIIAALFSPLRQRIQAWIDRRFFRARYNTEQMLERFALRQKENVDLQQYSGQLLDVLEDTLHPEFVSLYLIKTSRVRQNPLEKETRLLQNMH